MNGSGLHEQGWLAHKGQLEQEPEQLARKDHKGQPVRMEQLVRKDRKGSAGPTGATGARGATGATGATGPQGPAGPVSSAPTFTNVYVNDWFRNNGINEGLYNQATNSHWYSSGGGQWNLTGGSQTYIYFRNSHQSEVRGAVHFFS